MATSAAARQTKKLQNNLCPPPIMNLGRRQPQGFENGSYQDGTGAPGFSGGEKNQRAGFSFFHSLALETSLFYISPVAKCREGPR